MKKPKIKPKRPYFSSGPTVKYLGWNISLLKKSLLGRSHRSTEGKNKIEELLKLSRNLLEIPLDYKIALVPGSATGAMETLLWSLIGVRGLDIIVSDVFSKIWLHDCLIELKINPVSIWEDQFGVMPNLNYLNPENDWIFSWNGTTSGLSFNSYDEWIPNNRNGLTLCDATSAAFSHKLPWRKIDALAFSWQKALGGEGGHGMIVLSPRAIERLINYNPKWPIPRIFRIKNDNGEINDSLFNGLTINTPSLLCIEDYLLTLKWASSIGLNELINRTDRNFRILESWVSNTPWIDFVVGDKSFRSITSVCLKFTQQSLDKQLFLVNKIGKMLNEERVAFDIINHKLSPPSLRIWTGPTVEEKDVKNLIPWIEWAFKVKY